MLVVYSASSTFAAVPNAAAVSAVTGDGFEALAAAVANRLGGYVDAEIETSAGNGRLLSFLAQHAEVSDREYIDSRVRLRCRLPQAFARRLPTEEGDPFSETTVTWLDGTPQLTGKTTTS